MEKKQSATLGAIGVACVWMGILFHAGIAYRMQWPNGGVWTIIGTILAICLVGYGVYCAAEYSRIYKTYNYANWTSSVWGRKGIVYLIDLSFLWTMLNVLTNALRIMDTLAEYNTTGLRAFHLPVFLTSFLLNYWPGVIILLTSLLCAFGSKLVVKASAFMMCVVIAMLTIWGILCVISVQPQDLEAARQTFQQSHVNVGPLNTLAGFLGYVTSYGFIVGIIPSASNQLSNRSSAKKSAIIGICGSTLILVTLYILNLVTYPRQSSVRTLGVNIDSLSHFLSSSRSFGSLGRHYVAFSVVRSILVFIAALSTTVSFCFGAVARFSKLYRKPTDKTPIKDAALVVILLTPCALAAKFLADEFSRWPQSHWLMGFAVQYPTVVWILRLLNLLLLLLPAIFLAGRKISKKYISEKHIDAPGVDE